MDKLTYQKLKPGIYTFRIAILDGADGAVVESANYKIEKKPRCTRTGGLSYMLFYRGACADLGHMVHYKDAGTENAAEAEV